MAPLFGALKNLRRASRQSFRTETSGESSSDADAGSNGTAPTSGSITPPSISGQSDPALNLQIPKDEDGPYVASRPPLVALQTGSGNGSGNGSSGQGGNTNRYSMILGGSSPGSSMPSPRGKYAPRITNIEDRTWVHQRVLAIRGEVGEPNKIVDGVVIVYHANNQTPPTEWPVCASNFKALVSLTPGPNKLRFEYVSPRQGNSGMNTSWMSIHHVPTTNAPPLQLAILVAKDSPRTFDSIPSRIDREGNGIEAAVRKFRMAAYLWQAFMGEQMACHAKDEKARQTARRESQLVRRSFRFEEEWGAGTSHGRDRDSGAMRSEARVHIIEMDRTVAEIRDLELAQQNEQASNRDGLYDIALQAVDSYFRPRPGQKHYVAALMLDSHWDPKSQVVTGHAAVGGSGTSSGGGVSNCSGGGDTSLAIFGSHCLWTYPTCLEEVDPCFTDCNPTDTRLVSNTFQEGGSSWEACNIGVGLHLREVGRMFGLPSSRPSGLMRRGEHVLLHRSFVSREAFCTRTKEKGGPVALKEECALHPLDYLHLRTHPCFRTIIDSQPLDPGVAAWPTATDAVQVSAVSGLSHMEIYAEDEEECCGWVVFEPDTRRTTINERDLRHRLPPHKRLGRIGLVVRSLGGGSFETDDFKRLASKESNFKVEGRTLWRSGKVGGSALEDSEGCEVIFKGSASRAEADRVLRRVFVYHGDCLNGLEFLYDDESRQLFGNRGGKPGGDAFDLDTYRGEQIVGFKVRGDQWIDSLSILTSQGRMSPWYGGPSSGGGHASPSSISLVPPQGHFVCGVSGTCGSWVDGFSVIYRR